MEEWVEQLQDSVNTLEKLKSYINVTEREEEAITTLNTKWGTTPYFGILFKFRGNRYLIKTIKKFEKFS